MSHEAVGAPGTPRRYLHSLWLLSARDLKVRYATSFLGYLWSVLDIGRRVLIRGLPFQLYSKQRLLSRKMTTGGTSKVIFVGFYIFVGTW